MTEPAQTISLSKATGYMPIRTSAVNSPEMQAFYKQNPNYKTAIDQLRTAQRFPYTPALIEICRCYGWPDNLLEMERALARLAVMSGTHSIDRSTIVQYAPQLAGLEVDRGPDAARRPPSAPSIIPLRAGRCRSPNSFKRPSASGTRSVRDRRSRKGRSKPWRL